MRSKHQGEHPVNCATCITLAEKVRAPWQSSYIDVLISGAGESIKKKHKAAIKRQERKLR